MEFQDCNNCNRKLPISEFRYRKDKHWRNKVCKKCERGYNKNRREYNKKIIKLENLIY